MLVGHQYNVSKKYVGSVYISGYGGLLDVWLYSVLDTVVIYGEDVCCSVVFDTLDGLFEFSVICY